MSLPDYIVNMFKGKKSGKRPSASAIANIEAMKAQDIELRRAMDNGRADSYAQSVDTPIPEDFRAPYTAPKMTQPAPMQMRPEAPAPVPARQKQGLGNAVQRGIAGFLGFVPEGGTRGDAADGFANFGRALMGMDSVQKMESDYNASIAPERLRRALEAGDIEAIKRLDPETASQVQGVDETSYTGGRQRQFDEAVAAGDMEAMRRLDPEAADLRDTARREAALRAARAASQIGSQDPTKGAAVLKQFATEQPNLFTAQELQVYDQGGPEALEAMLTGGPEDPYAHLMNTGGGGIYNAKTDTWDTPPTKPLTEKELLDLELLRARIGQVNRSNRGTGTAAAASKGGTAQDKSSFTASLNNLAETAVELGKIGAIGMNGMPAKTPGQSMIFGRGGKDGEQSFAQAAGQLFGFETAEKFSARQTQVSSAVRGFAKAAGISSGSMNSNFELQNVSLALSNALSPMEDQVAAADAMSLTYGDGTRTADYLFDSGQITEAQYNNIVSRTQSFEGNIRRGVAQERANGNAGDEEIVRVNTPEEAMQLEPGTQFMTPDGRMKVR